MSDDMNEHEQDSAIYSVILGFVLLAAVLGGVLFIFSQQNNDEDSTQDDPTPTITQDSTPTPTVEITQETTPTQEQPTPSVTPTPENTGEITIELTGQPYEFSSDQITVSQGALVTIEFTSTDGFHDFVIDELGVSTDRVNTGNTASAQFIAEEPGTYTFYCSVGNHRALGMEGTLIIE